MLFFHNSISLYWVAFHFVEIILCIKRCGGFFFWLLQLCSITFYVLPEDGVKSKIKCDCTMHKCTIFSFTFFVVVEHGNSLRANASHEHAHLNNQRFLYIFFIQPLVHLLSNDFQTIVNQCWCIRRAFVFHFRSSVSILNTYTSWNRNCQYSLRMCNIEMQHMCRMSSKSPASALSYLFSRSYFIIFSFGLFFVLDYNFSHLFDIYNEIILK